MALSNIIVHRKTRYPVLIIQVKVVFEKIGTLIKEIMGTECLLAIRWATLT